MVQHLMDTTHRPKTVAMLVRFQKIGNKPEICAANVNPESESFFLSSQNFCQEENLVE